MCEVDVRSDRREMDRVSQKVGKKEEIIWMGHNWNEFLAAFVRPAVRGKVTASVDRKSTKGK